VSARRRAAWAALNLFLAALLLLAGRRVLRAAGALGRDEAVARASGAQPRNVSLEGVLARAPDGARRPVAAPGQSGLVLVFDPECVPCGANMWNWTELARELPRGLRLVALTVEGARGGDGYWTGLTGRVDVLAVDSAAMRDVLRVGTTPTTLVVKNGTVVREYVGALTSVAKDELIAELGGGRPAGAAR
jgi:hypothetical protein